MRGGRTKAGLLAALAGVFCFAGIVVASDDDPRGNPHAHFRNLQQCPECHLVLRSGTETGRFSTETDLVCLGCHRKEGLGRTHPVGVRPREKYGKMKVPSDLRVDDDGRIMCLTCHEAHGAYLSKVKAFPGQIPFPSDSSGGPYYKTFFLRRSSPTRGSLPLCDACHEKR